MRCQYCYPCCYPAPFSVLRWGPACSLTWTFLVGLAGFEPATS